jgi:MFS family permease
MGRVRPARQSSAQKKVALALLAVSLALAYGIWYAYSVILVALLNEFGWSRSVLAGAFSLFAIVQGCCNPLIGMLCDRFAPALLMALGGLTLGVALICNSLINEPWQFYLSFGGLTAVAVAFCGWVPAVVQVQRQFHSRLGLAIGIVSSGVGVGMLLVVPLCQVLIEAFGWRTAFRVLAAICVAVIVPAALYLLAKTPPHQALTATSAAAPGTNVAAVTAVTLAEALRTAPFWLMVMAFFFGSLCAQTLHVHQVAYLVDHGIAALVAASVVGVVGTASVLGKTGGGWLSDRIEREVVFVAGIAILVASVAALPIAGAMGSKFAAYLYAILLGIGYSATAALIPAMLSDRFQGQHFGSILGIGLFGSATGSALGPWLAGHIFDVTGSYGLAFTLAGICGVIAGAAGWIARGLRRRARLTGELAGA